MVPPDTTYAAPPYSCTRVRTLVPAGVTSAVRPSRLRLTTTLRPPSSGRLSSQYVSSPSRMTRLSCSAPAATAWAVSGDFHAPYGAATGSGLISAPAGRAGRIAAADRTAAP